MQRVDKANYYLDIAEETVIERGTCLRRNFGAIIVRNDEIISTGYTGAPRGRNNCSTSGSACGTSLTFPRRKIRNVPKRTCGSQLHYKRLTP